MSVEPTRIASAPASSAAAPCARGFDAALGDDDAVARDARHQVELGSPVDPEARQVAGVHADHGRAEPNGPFELVGVVRFDEDVQPELGRVRKEPGRGGVVEIAEEQERGVGPCVARCLEVFAGGEEALGEERDAARGAGSPQVVPRSSEATVDEDRDSCGSRGLVSGRQLRRIGVRPEVTGRGRAPFDLGDPAEARLGESVREPAHQAGTSSCVNAMSSSSRVAACARVDRLRCERVAVRKIAGMPSGCDRPGGVQEHCLPLRPRSAGEDLAHGLGVLGRRASAEICGPAARHAEVRGIDLALDDASVHDLADEVRPRGRELVDATRAVDDEGAPRSELGEHVSDRRHELGGVDADNLRAGSGRVRERAEHVEDRACRELLAHRRCVAHGRVVGGCEEEAEAELVDRARDPVGLLLEPKAERLEHVGRAGRRRYGPVAVLRDPGSRRRGDERSRSGDIECARAVAAGAGSVDEVFALRPYGEHVGAHGLGAAGNLVRGLALEAEGDEEAADLGGGRLPGHDRVHDLTGFVAREVVAVEDSGERSLDHRRPSRKFLARSGPDGVSTDSG